MMRFILASKSPRRSFFLRERGYLFHTFPVEISEFLNKNLNISEAVEDLAQRKAAALVEGIQSGHIFDLKSHYLILAADTIVYHQGDVLGKPKDREDAFATLRRLSGDTHQVITAFCLWNTSENRWVTGHCTSDVKFRELNDQEIWQYVDSGDPMDKAGSYGIQSLARKFIQKNSHQIQTAKEEQLGSTFRTQGEDFVTHFTGSLENIAGLPIDEVERVAKMQGWEFPRN